MRRIIALLAILFEAVGLHYWLKAYRDVLDRKAFQVIRVALLEFVGPALGCLRFSVARLGDRDQDGETENTCEDSV